MRICEIFRSIQGEGRGQGYPTIFIRLAGCNLNCAWCDTRYAREGGEELSVERIMDRVWRLCGSRVCITGGEPLVQSDALLPLVDGTIDFRRFQPHATICMDVKCPSSGETSDLTLLPFIRAADTVKFVVGNEEDCRYARQVMGHFPIRGEIFLSPVEGSDAASIAAFMLENNLRARLQLQLHKCIGVK
jgi:7-carboxy-7-deazaguanine synthase